ncbi:hypothetical protein R1sor_026515 [Riccia sorocarpa]|uniref:Uncharacterized protein n=1 Tax=Riccia sorocarpa TaxID=122646 RepID=A0ABD3GEF9_9MARC
MMTSGGTIRSAATSQDLSTTRFVYFMNIIEKKSRKLLKEEVDLETEEDITEKLSDSALEIIAMVVVGCDTKDELAPSVSKFIAHANRHDTSKKPFAGHKNFTVLQKCRMLVEHSLASERISMIGRGQLKHQKIGLTYRYMSNQTFSYEVSCEVYSDIC